MHRIDGPLAELSVGQLATLACLLEVTAPKPGNVHRGADFEDLLFTDFAVSATCIAPAMQKAPEAGVGATVLRAVEATRALVPTNTNLGTVLLLAPLAAVPRNESLRNGLPRVLAQLSPDDCRDVYAAIRRAGAGGLGRVESMDVHDAAPQDLLAAMMAAAGRDLVARQYTNGFQEVFDRSATLLAEGCRRGWSISQAIVQTQMMLMSEYPDSLIQRKCGAEVARESAHRAAMVLDAGGPGDESWEKALADFDFWLRIDGHRRNPGTTADLLAAGLFVCLREQTIQPPFR